jgi:CHAD domain-containing protein
MAQARAVEGLEAGDRFEVAAGRVVAVRARELFAQAEGVLDTDDVERVHDMRVASRRLRAVLEIFAPAFPARAHAPVLRDVKALADALGARRDPDVQLEAFAVLREQLDEADRPAIDLVVDRLRAEQQAGNSVLAAALEEARASNLAARLAALAADALDRP